MKRLVIFHHGINEELANMVCYKDFASYGYYLGKICGWQCKLLYFSDNIISNPNFEEYCELERLGSICSQEDMLETIDLYLKNNAKDIDVAVVNNYGHFPYGIASLCKKYNKGIKVWSKLDMNSEGFSHFYDGTFMRKITSSIEKIKSRNIDLFSVESKEYYDILKNHCVFKNKIFNLPNCPSLLGINLEKLDAVEKENLILFVGRVGDYYKNNELMIKALCKIPVNAWQDWKVILVGPSTDEFRIYLDKVYKEFPYIKKHIELKGPIYDREMLYSLMSKSKIFIMTSRSESYGIAAIEAGMMGCYPVLTEFGASVREITNNGKCGTYVDNYDELKFANALLSVMQDTEIKEKNDAVRKYVRSNFSYERFAKVIDSIM